MTDNEEDRWPSLMDREQLMARDRDHVHQVAREFLTRSEDVDRKADLAVSVHDADIAYMQAAQRLAAAYEAALEGGWSHAELGALGFTLPTVPVKASGLPTKITRRSLRSAEGNHVARAD